MSLVPATIGRKLAHTTLLAQKNSPKFLFGAGLVGMVGSTVLACRATLKVDGILEGAKESFKDVEKALEKAEVDPEVDYSKRDAARDRSLVYYQTSVKIVRLYGPSIILGGISIYALSSSHNILTKRNAALTAAYTALEKGFSEYRARVVEKYGEDEDRNLRYGSHKVEIEDPETGKKKKVTRVAPGEPSIYARFFDETSSSWDRDPEINRFFLQSQQNYANNMLHARGHVFLNEVYDMLGIRRSKAGSVVGWLLTPDGRTDNFIDFGVFNADSDKARDFVNGYEGAILLDFNVDGVIYDKIDFQR